MSDTDPTPEKYLVEFLAKWIRDEDFRCAILKRELSELQAYGLTEPQINDLLTLDKQTIVGRILKEFEHDLGIDLPRVKSEVHGVEITPLPPGAGSPSPVNPGGGSELILPVRRPRLPGLGSASVRRAMAAVGASSTAGVVEAAYATTVAFLMSAATVYAEGQVHIRGVTPPTLSQGDDRILVIRGQGFDEASKIQVRFRKGPKHKNADVLGVTCDVDVYQRVTVRVTLDELGEWAVQARNQGESVWSTEDVSVVVI